MEHWICLEDAPRGKQCALEYQSEPDVSAKDRGVEYNSTLLASDSALRLLERSSGEDGSLPLTLLEAAEELEVSQEECEGADPSEARVAGDASPECEWCRSEEATEVHGPLPLTVVGVVLLVFDDVSSNWTHVVHNDNAQPKFNKRPPPPPPVYHKYNQASML
jgi:hypothetical protein